MLISTLEPSRAYTDELTLLQQQVAHFKSLSTTLQSEVVEVRAELEEQSKKHEALQHQFKKMVDTLSQQVHVLQQERERNADLLLRQLGLTSINGEPEQRVRNLEPLRLNKKFNRVSIKRQEPLAFIPGFQGVDVRRSG